MQKWLLVILLIGVNSAFSAQSDSLRLAKLLPEKFNDYRGEDVCEFYTTNNLFDYMDGGAELYFAFGFRSLLHRVYRAPNKPEILVDIYDMGTPQNAFAIFVQSRQQKIDVTLGRGGQYVRGFLNFWKDRYYVTMLILKDTFDQQKEVLSFARHIAANIPEGALMPFFLERLPFRNLKTSSLRYLPDFEKQKRFVVVDLKLKDFCEQAITDVLVAEYQNDVRLVILGFADHEQASACFKKIFSIQNDKMISVKYRWILIATGKDIVEAAKLMRRVSGTMRKR